MVVYVLIALGILASFFAVVFTKDIILRFKDDNTSIIGMAISTLIGFITDFFDTLGIGSFGPTTALLKLTKQSDDRLLPGTLNVSHTIPVVIEAFFFINVIKVEIVTLISLIAASVIGAYFGAGVISKLEKRTIKIIMGFALIVVAVLMLLSNIGLISRLGEGNEDLGLSGIKLIITICIFLVLGALMSAGVGLYAPAMATVYFMGLHPILAFPIMMGACAFLMPIGSAKFIKEKAYSLKTSLCITIGGIVGVLIAANLVTTFNITVLTRVVIGVVTITGLIMLYEAFIKDKNTEKEKVN